MIGDPSHDGFKFEPDEFDNPPPGYVYSGARGPFTSHNGPFFHMVDEDGAFWHGFRARQRHCNSHHIVHGGILMTFADGLLATAVWRETNARSVTIRMTSDLLDMVRPGSWVCGSARVTRATRTIAFVEGEVSVAGKAVLSASGVFKLLGPGR